MSILFLTAMVLFCVYVALHLVVTRIYGNRSYLIKAYSIFLAISILLVKPLLDRFGVLNAIIIYFNLVLFWNLYLTFFINLMNSISLRIMLEINESSQKKLTYQNIKNLYNNEEILGKRINELAINKFIKISENYIDLTGKGKILAGFLHYLRNIFSINFYG
ncbi:MAG: hypothetical protein PHV30_04925 [Candidatus Margulisbacteria bacterium]|nr:hypothetical protein [Candidatus Margulisiibacteriota bacterium]